MKIMSWNCGLTPWSGTRKIRPILICGMIFDLKPDIVCLQEIFFKTEANFIIKFLSNFYPHSFYYKNLLILSKFPLENKASKIFKKQGNYFSRAFFDRMYGRAWLQAEFEEGGEKYLIVNTQLLSAGKQEQHEKVRVKQLEEIFEDIENKLEKKIIVGDLNFGNKDEAAKVFARNNYSDLLEKNSNTTLDNRLDYIITKNLPGGVVSLASDLKEKLSDHRIIIWEQK